MVAPISLLTAIAGGMLNKDPWLVPKIPNLHPMAPAGLAFGVGTLIAGIVVFQRRRLWMLPLMPLLHTAAFGLAGMLMSLADKRLWAGGDTARFIVELSLGSFAGMMLISASLLAAGVVSIGGAARFGTIGTVLGALCVAVVNVIHVLSPPARLFWSMFIWHLVMMQYLAWLNLSKRQNS